MKVSAHLAEKGSGAIDLKFVWKMLLKCMRK